jgi:hypothetical protein
MITVNNRVLCCNSLCEDHIRKSSLTAPHLFNFSTRYFFGSDSDCLPSCLLGKGWKIRNIAYCRVDPFMAPEAL